jgi:hypothetical protein
MAEQFLQLSRDDRREVLAIAARKPGGRSIFWKRTRGSSGRCKPFMEQRLATTLSSKAERPSPKLTTPSAGYRKMST